MARIEGCGLREDRGEGRGSYLMCEAESQDGALHCGLLVWPAWGLCVSPAQEGLLPLHRGKLLTLTFQMQVHRVCLHMWSACACACVVYVWRWGGGRRGKLEPNVPTARAHVSGFHLPNCLRCVLPRLSLPRRG